MTLHDILGRLFGYIPDNPLGTLCHTCVYGRCDCDHCDTCNNCLSYKDEETGHVSIRCYCTCKHSDYPAVSRCRRYKHI